MRKPTVAELSVLYPSVNADYLNDYIDRKCLLIQQEDDVVEMTNALLNSFREQIIGVLYLPTEQNKAELIKQKVSDLEFQLANIEVDGAIQLHETSGYLYQWILDKWFGSDVTHEVGGEQKTDKSFVSRKAMLKSDIQKVISNTVSRNQNISTSISGALESFVSDINRLGSNVSVADVDRAMGRVRREVTQSTRSMLQQSVYDAERNTTITVSDDYQIVYYRVEVLDSNICMSCLEVDGSINDVPLGLLHKNCRGMDVILLRDLETGKYYDTSHHGYGHKMRTRTFEQKFEALSQKQKRQMLGKSNYELYTSGQLKANDFLSNGRQITNAEAKLKIDAKKLRAEINTPQKATNMARHIESLFTKDLADMDSGELLAYEKMLGIQKQLYENVPAKVYSKSRPKQSYIDAIDAKYDEINKLRGQ